MLVNILSKEINISLYVAQELAEPFFTLFIGCYRGLESKDISIGEHIAYGLI
jgi:hypothetical protein